MSYAHLQYQVQMTRSSASTADTGILPTTGSRVVGVNAHNLNVTTGDGWGSAHWGPAFYPVQVKAVAVESTVNLSDAQALYYRIRRGTATAVAGTSLTLPTTTATGPMFVKRVTSNMIVYPGDKVIVSVSTIVADIRLNSYLLIEPVWEQLENVTTVAMVTNT